MLRDDSPLVPRATIPIRNREVARAENCESKASVAARRERGATHGEGGGVGVFAVEDGEEGLV